ncbi:MULTISPECIES: HAD family hydrolase [Pontibacillus]|uniref:HAD hydrolase-like protein n=1 Tax=Pontibacillus chungwhensis TaxID=265426 RepID=A0ABY8UTK8_9BACI|nr:MULTISPECIES: HAD hydrolase-like protein [Pontibacillus]MCD5323150.1 HAD hydrolase-like protein [Pontibacillus sp. HN14]WIF96538.1 HAD hydrolase-like protein [Pontibacillus chungwhensis]
MGKTILFDVDGVLLSEHRYFDASALTVWELIHSENYLGLQSDRFHTDVTESEVGDLRAEVFQEDEVLYLIKSKGINANWDMVYLTFSFQLIRLLAQLNEVKPKYVEKVFQDMTLDRQALQEIGGELYKAGIEPDYKTFVPVMKDVEAMRGELLTHLNQIAYEMTGIETMAFTRNSALWELGRETFQEWYVGEDLTEKSIGRPPYQQGKGGFVHIETPLATMEELDNLFTKLKDDGYTLGIGTGRPALETVEPLENLGILSYFDRNRMATASDVLEAEKKYGDKAPLAKPNPFTYMFAWLGRSSIEEALDYSFTEEEKDSVIIVGDSLADGLAAQSLGCHFVAVLTGLSGQKARKEFEQNDQHTIIDNIKDLHKVL